MTDDFEHGLAALAEHGHRTGRMETAAALRERGDRRRRRRYAATAAFGVVLAGALGAGIALAQPRNTTPTPVAPASTSPSPAPSPSAAPSRTPSSPPSTTPTSKAPPSSPPAGSGSGGVLSGSRQLFVFVLDNGAEIPDTVLAVTESGRLDVTADYGDRALLVPVPTAPGSKKYLVKTGKLRSGGEALCLQVQNNGSDPLTLVTKACDTSEKDQLFAFEENGRDNQDRMTYRIQVNGVYMHYSPDGQFGLIVEESGEGDDLTSFVLIDRGKATLPTF
jgi:hypothetical protein